MKKQFVVRSEPEEAPVEWDDPKIMTGEWCVALTPRVLKGMENENPHKGRYINEERCGRNVYERR